MSRFESHLAGSIVDARVARCRPAGIITAVVAYLVIKIEAYLFDLKTGFCTSRPWWTFGTEQECSPGAWREWNELGRTGELVYFSIAVSRVVGSLSTSS